MKRAMKAAALAALTLGLSAGVATAQKLKIVDRPIPFTQERIDLSRQYIKQHYGLDVQSLEIVPRVIVLHWTGVGTFNGSYNTFVPATLNGSRPDLAKAGDLNVGIQFLVDRE